MFILFSKNYFLGAPCAANLWIRRLFAMDLITRSIAEFAMDVYGKILNSYLLILVIFYFLGPKLCPPDSMSEVNFTA